MTRAWRAVCLASAAAALAVTAGVLALGMLPGETALRAAILAGASPALVAAARRINVAGTWRVLVPSALLLELLPGARRRWWLWAAVLVAGPLIGEAWQQVVGRRRPVGAALGFPSGHATATGTYAVVAIYLLARARLPRAVRLPLQALAAGAALPVGVARLVLDAHWPADVAGGFALGSACAAAAAWWDAAHPPDPLPGATGRTGERATVLVLAALLLAGCGQRADTPGVATKPLVVASVYPLYDFARQVAGDRAEVRALVPPGVEPHDWEPTPQDVAQVRKARVFVYNGLGLEPWAGRVLAEAVGRDAVVVRVTDDLPLAGPTAGPGPGPAPPDPHTWLDPVLARAEVEAIRAALARADPAGAEGYAGRARAFTARLVALDGSFRAGLRDCARRELFTSHAAFGHLARRYGLVQVPLMGLAPEAEPSPADLAALVRLARARQVRYVFSEPLVSPKLAAALAREIGAETLVLNPVEGLTAREQAAGLDYVGAMEENLKSLRKGLGCR